MGKNTFMIAKQQATGFPGLGNMKAEIIAEGGEGNDLETTFSEAQDRFVYAEDATLQGIYLKLRLLAESESLSNRLEDGPNLLGPRIILTILRDLQALGSLHEPTGEF
jgi:hypothetical protein